ncbi:PAS domain-containing hybrid sensor histidine kinase/response regulator [Spirosoma radiotolerans]|uniref:PAS domain-containing hybrid sensor histidine kinase/response regulator n=1 Tax=Spirosoma radiotolerans TaxID=1379870 RepID=UPI0006972FF4|nr:ATP-binding protein [Spirosoma radiotolerans]
MNNNELNRFRPNSLPEEDHLALFVDEWVRLAMQTSDTYWWQLDLLTNQASYSPNAERILGHPPAPILQANLGYVHPDDRLMPTQAVEQAIRTGTDQFTYQVRSIAQSAQWRWFQVSGTILRDQQGQPTKMIGQAQNITDRKQAEEALREADRRKDEFLAMLAHELRNPLVTLRSGLDILKMTTTQDEQSSATVSMMSRQTNHLVRMVDELLDVNRINQGKIELQKQPLNLVELVQQAAQSMQGLFNQQGRTLRVELPQVPIYLQGDATRLSQVVTNLLTNGVRYTGEGGQVWLRLEQASHEAQLQVGDDGIGLSVDQLEAVFESFVQVDNSPARSKGGLGLGLTLVKRLVELHGGRVEAQSEGIGQGSTFRVHLPTLETAPDVSPKSLEETTSPASSERILVIDDNTDAALTLSLLLTLKGYEAHTRTSGRAGIAAAQQLQPAAILLDIGMPELDGYETCRLLREQPWGEFIPVIAISGYGQEADRERSQEAGFDGHLVKPVDVAMLTERLRELIGQGKLKQRWAE